MSQKHSEADPHSPVTGYPDFTEPITITGVTIETLPIDIKTQTIAELKIDVAAQSLAELKVNITAQAVTLDVNIAAQTVDLNIKTGSGVNIVIDKLTQTAYLERRAVFSNNGETASWLSNNHTNYRGKFFPRGCRSFIRRVEVYCRNTSANDDAFSVLIGYQMGVGFVWAKANIISVPANAAAGWRGCDCKIPFNYDSFFIAVRAATDDRAEIGYDTVEKPDGFDSGDTYTWTSTDRRYWIRVYFEGLTVGDIPVSGTINAVGIPNMVGDLKEISWSAIDGGGSAKVINIVRTCGVLRGVILHIKQVAGTVAADKMELTWDIDGVTYTDTMDYYLKPFAGVANIHAPINMFKIDTTNNDYAFATNFPIPFRQKIILTVKNNAAAGNKISVDRWHMYERLV